MQDGFYGCLPQIPPETNYQLVAGKFDLPTPRFTFKDKKIQYYQPKVSAVSCTAFSKMGCFSDQTGYRFTYEEAKAIWESCKKYPTYPANEQDGGYQSTAAKVTTDFWNNKFPNDKIRFFQIDLISPEADLALSKGYSLDVVYHGNSDYNIDHYSDGRLDLTKLLAAVQYGHNVRLFMQDGKLYIVVDNYFTEGSTTNTYEISKENLAELVKNKVFDPQSYVFAFINDIEHPQTNVSPFAIKSWDKALKMSPPVVNKYSDPKSIAGTKWDEKLLIYAKLLTSELGTLTLERKICAMDRAGLLN